MFAGSCCIGNKIYKASDRIPAGILVCREPGAIGHEYVVVEGLRIDFSAADRDLTGVLWGQAKLQVSNWIPVPRDSCYEVHFSPCSYGSDDVDKYTDGVIGNVWELEANPGYYNVIWRSCRDLDTIILP